VTYLLKLCICAGMHLTEGQPSEWADSQPRRTWTTPFWDHARWEALQIIAALFWNQHNNSQYGFWV